VGISTPGVRTSQFRYIDLSSGYWRNLWSSVEFIDKPLKSCVDVIHTGIVDIWDLNDPTRVSSPHFPDFLASHWESVFVKRPIQEKHVPRRERSRCTSLQCIEGVSYQQVDISG